METHRPALRHGERKIQGASPRWALRAGLIGLLLLGALPGCTTFIDEVATNKEFKFKDLFRRDPEPLKVLADSTSGDARARALRKLKEPAQNGGSEHEQQVILKVLSQAATEDKLVTNRLAAISTLGRFRDPRAAEVLEEAYYRADSNGINSEHASVIRCQALRSLGESGNPRAIPLLVRVLREPAVEGAVIEKQRRTDERTAAARALGNFNYPESNQTLLAILREDQDVALRYRAHESLQQATGQNFPDDPIVWADYLDGKQPDPARVRPVGFVDRVLRWVSGP